jgi:hypothetical protein
VAYGRIPVGAANFIIRVSASRGKKVSSLGDIFFSLLPPYFNLLLLSAASEVILLEGTFTFVGCGTRGASRQRNQKCVRQEELTLSTGLHSARLGIIHCYRSVCRAMLIKREIGGG